MAALPPRLTGTEDLADIVGRALRAAVGPLHKLASSHPDVAHKNVGTWSHATSVGHFPFNEHKEEAKTNRDHERDPSILLKWIVFTWHHPRKSGKKRLVNGPWQRILRPAAGKRDFQKVLDLRNAHAHNDYDRTVNPLDAAEVGAGLQALTKILAALKAEEERTYVESLYAETAKRERRDSRVKRHRWKDLKRDQPIDTHTVGLHWVEITPEEPRPKKLWLVHLPPDGPMKSPNGAIDPDYALHYLLSFSPQDRVLVGCAFCFSTPSWLVERVTGEPGQMPVERMWQRFSDSACSTSASEDLIGQLNAQFGCESGPFWSGDANEPNPNSQRDQEEMRDTERFVAEQTNARPSSVFMVGGDAGVGALAVDGMALLLPELRKDDFRIWPFDQAGPRTVVEIFPRSLWAATQYNSPVHSRPTDRENFVESQNLGLGGQTRDRLIAERRYFDALMTAWALQEYGGNIHRFPKPDPASKSSLEGRIWLPTPNAER